MQVLNMQVNLPENMRLSLFLLQVYTNLPFSFFCFFVFVCCLQHQGHTDKQGTVEKPRRVQCHSGYFLHQTLLQTQGRLNYVHAAAVSLSLETTK